METRAAMAGVIQVVIDTNVVVAAIKSSSGASHQIITDLRNDRWKNNISSTLFLEYEEQIRQHAGEAGMGENEIQRMLRDLSSASERRDIYYRWPDYARDQDDRLVLDVAVNVRADYVITFNRRNFVRAKELGVKIVTPGEFLTLKI